MWCNVRIKYIKFLMFENKQFGYASLSSYLHILSKLAVWLHGNIRGLTIHAIVTGLDMLLWTYLMLQPWCLNFKKLAHL